MYNDFTSPTVQGQQLAQMNNTLGNINNAPPAQMSQIPQGQLATAATTVGNAANTMSANAPQFATDVQNQYNQQLVQPLTNQYSNMDQLFQLYMHDNNLAQQYGTITGGTGSTNAYQDPNLMARSQVTGQALQSGNQSDLNAILGMTTGVQPNTFGGLQATTTPSSPYLASSQDIVNNVLNSIQNPNITTSQMNQPLNAGNELTNLLSSLIGTEQNYSTMNAQDVINLQQGRNNIMQNLANFLTGQISQNSVTKDTSGFNVGSTQDAASVLATAKDNLLKANPNASEYDLFNYINQNQALLKAQGVNVDAIWKQFHSMFGNQKDALLAGGKVTPASQKQQVAHQAAIDGLRSFGDVINAYYQNVTNLGPLHVENSLLGGSGSKYFSQRDIYARKIQSALKGSRTQAAITDLLKNLPGGTSMNPEAGFEGHFTSLLDNTGLRLGIDKSGTVHIMDSSDWDPNKFKSLDPNSLSMDQIRTLINSL